mgnify:CR=1 FL=1
MLGFARALSAPLVRVPIAVLALRHHDVVHRTRQGRRPRERVLPAGLGRRGRIPVAAVAGLPGLLPFAYAAPAAYLGVLSGAESVLARARGGHGSGVMVDLKE